MSCRSAVIKDSGLGYKEGVWEAMKSFTNVKTIPPAVLADMSVASAAFTLGRVPPRHDFAKSVSWDGALPRARSLAHRRVPSRTALARRPKLTVYTLALGEADQLAAVHEKSKKAVPSVEVEWVRDPPASLPPARFLAEKDNPKCRHGHGACAASSLLAFSQKGRACSEASLPARSVPRRCAKLFRSAGSGTWTSKVPHVGIFHICFNTVPGAEGRPAAPKSRKDPDRRQIQERAGDAASGLLWNGVPDGCGVAAADGRRPRPGPLADALHQNIAVFTPILGSAPCAQAAKGERACRHRC